VLTPAPNYVITLSREGMAVEREAVSPRNRPITDIELYRIGGPKKDEGCFSSLLDTLGKVLARRGTGRAAGSFG
jgi:hypothetical protein